MAGQPLNQPAEIPAELDRWNWGAFFLNWIWGIGNSTFIALLALIPIVNIVMIFVLGARGSRWAWRNRVWRDAEQFRRTQRNWAIAGLAVWVLSIGGCATMVGGIPFMIKGSDAYHMTMEVVRADTRVKAAIGDDVTANFWVGGHLNVNADGTGDAQFSIPIHGAKGKGTVFSHLVRNAGTWSTRLLVVRVEGADAPIVLTNEDHVPIPERGNRNMRDVGSWNAKTAPHRERGFARYAWRFATQTLGETYGLRYARPDPERRADAISASQSVL